MTYKKVSKAIQKLSNNLLSDSQLANHIIYQKGSMFYVFGMFTLEEFNDIWLVKSDKRAHVVVLPREFTQSKIALAWCILVKSGHVNAAKDLHRSDRLIAQKQANIENYIHSLAQLDIQVDFRDIVHARLAEDIGKRQQLKKQLNKCLERTKYIQIKGISKS